jgi:hypothetical protein
LNDVCSGPAWEGIQTRVDRGEPVAEVLPSADGEIAVFAAVPVHIDGTRLVAWMRRIEELKRSSYVPEIGRVSEPPRIEDLAGLELDEEDLADVRMCRPGNCGLALSDAEMTRLQRAAQGGDNWKADMQREFPHLLEEHESTVIGPRQVESKIAH